MGLRNGETSFHCEQFHEWRASSFHSQPSRWSSHWVNASVAAKAMEPAVLPYRRLDNTTAGQSDTSGAICRIEGVHHPKPSIYLSVSRAARGAKCDMLVAVTFLEKPLIEGVCASFI